MDDIINQKIYIEEKHADEDLTKTVETLSQRVVRGSSQMLLINPAMAEKAQDKMSKYSKYCHAFKIAYVSVLKCLNQPSHKNKLYKIKTSLLTIDPIKPQFNPNLITWKEDETPTLDHIYFFEGCLFNIFEDEKSKNWLFTI